jgi:putative component of membrane protein insertase Oxa1/YidC/SpoIIIJ protein YidD
MRPEGIPALVCGIPFFLLAGVCAAQTELARDLWAEGDWQNARRECLRVLEAAPADDAARALEALAAIRLGDRSPKVLEALDQAAAADIGAELRAWAGFEAARLRRGAEIPQEPPPRSLAAKPAEWITLAYRRCIGPAIGARCSLTPSCSAYFREAGRKHGLLAFPMAADRLVREPSVVSRARDPVRVGRQIRYPDPLSAHDGWLGGRKP